MHISSDWLDCTLRNPRIDRSELLARVAYQLVIRDWRQHPDRYRDPASGVSLLSKSLAHVGFPHLHTYLAAMAYYVRPRYGSALHWRNTVVRRARNRVWLHFIGKPWRRQS